jgi:Protein tyrosine and serine/threonine kinase
MANHLTCVRTRADMVDRVFQYAERVAGGFRQALPEDWPPEVRALIADCWQSNPIARPSAAKVRRSLKS